MVKNVGLIGLLMSLGCYSFTKSGEYVFVKSVTGLDASVKLVELLLREKYDFRISDGLSIKLK